MKYDANKKLDRETFILIVNAISLFLHSLLFILTIYMFFSSNVEFDYGIRGYTVFALIYIVVLSFFYYVFESFKILNKSVIEEIISISVSLFFTNFVMYFVFGLIEGHLVIVYPFIIMILLQYLVCIFVSYFGNKIRVFYYPAKKTLLVYGSKKSNELIEKINRYQNNEFKIIKTLKEDIVDIKKINDILNKYECVITVEIKHEIKKEFVKKCYEKNIYIYDVPSITDVFIKTSVVTNYIDTPLFLLNKVRPSKIEIIIKRVMDIFGSLLLLLITLPITFISIIIIKLQDGGDIFFKQKRLTLDGKEFKLIKFRSMIMNAEPDGKAIRAKINDERITRYGRFIRATRIDELPQVLNILKGDLSFVGPRALRIEEYEQNEKEFPEFKYRLKVKAGLTGYAQVYGKYNTSFRDKLLLDIYYIENYSIAMDIKLILMTIVTMFTKDSTEGF